MLGRGFDDGLDAETFEFVGGKRTSQVGFVGDEKDGFATLSGFLGQLAVGG